MIFSHGLPVELGVEKQLGISGKHEIEKFGVENFIQQCKESVFKYERDVLITRFYLERFHNILFLFIEFLNITFFNHIEIKQICQNF